MKHALMMLAIVLLASCGKSGDTKSTGNTPSDSSDTPTSETFVQPKLEGNPQSDDYVLARVKAIYDNIFEDNYRVMEDDESDIPEEVLSPDEKFCTKAWNDLLAKVDEFDSTNNPDEQGFWDFDYWVMGQDFDKPSISDVSLVKRDGDKAVVDLKVHNFDEATSVRLELKFERGEWFIDNIIDTDNDYDLKKEMTEHIKG